jgi:hypothetical protein
MELATLGCRVGPELVQDASGHLETLLPVRGIILACVSNGLRVRVGVGCCVCGNRLCRGCRVDSWIGLRFALSEPGLESFGLTDQRAREARFVIWLGSLHLELHDRSTFSGAPEIVL